MTNERMAIPEELRRQVLIEAGHRCAIPTCRHIDVDIHHIVPLKKCKEHKYENLIALCPNCHRRANQGKIDRKSLLLYKANLRYAHDKFSQFEIDLLFNIYKLPPNTGLLLPTHLMFLASRLIDAGYIRWTVSKDVFMIGELKLNADHITITTKGRGFIETLGVKKL